MITLSPRIPFDHIMIASNLNRPLVIATAFAIATALPTLILLVVDTRVLQDEMIWLKPLKFQTSLALMAITLIWAIARFGPTQGRSAWITWPAFAVAATTIYEISFLMIQAARGVPSHFNRETSFDAIGHALMQAGASVLVLGAALVGLVILSRSLWQDRLNDPVALAAGLGLAIGGFLGGYTGSFIGMNGGPFVGVYDASDPIWPIFGWSRTIGDLRVAHFFGLHMMQALPLLAILLPIKWPPLSRSGAVIGLACLWVVITLWTLTTAQAGQPFLTI